MPRSWIIGRLIEEVDAKFLADVGIAGRKIDLRLVDYRATGSAAKRIRDVTPEIIPGVWPTYISAAQ